MLHSLLLLGALSSTPTTSPAEAVLPAAAEQALRRAAALYSAPGARGASFTQTYTPAGFANARREEGTVVIQPPQRLRFDYAAPDPKVFTYDAGEGRFYSPADGQLTVRKLSAEERARLPIVFLTSPQELAATYTVSVEPAPDGGESLLLRPRDPHPELAWLRLGVGSDGSVASLAYEDEAGNRTEFRFGPWRAEAARPTADFHVVGPKGTRIVD